MQTSKGKIKDTSQASPPCARPSGSQSDLVVVLLLVVFVFAGCFPKTVVGKACISKLSLIASKDSFHSGERYAVYRTKFDPSLYQFHIPFQIYNEEVNRKGQIALWNPMSGCGFPALGELQYCLFSPFRFIFKASSPYLYNLGIVVKAATGVAATYFLARLIGLSIASSVLPAMAFGLCPFVLRELELPNEFQLLPVTMALFLKLSYASGWKARIALAAFCAVLLTMIHPEFFFIDVMAGASFACLVSAMSGSRRSEGHDEIQNAGWAAPPPAFVAKNILCAGAIAFCLGAPLILPFLEFIRNGETYKFGSFTPQFIPIKTLFTSLTTPAFGGGSPFPGVVAAALIPLALLGQNGRVKALLALAAAAALFSSVPGPLFDAAVTKPFSFIPPRYFITLFLLSAVLIAGFGLEQLLLIQARIKDRRLIVLFISAIAVALLPSILNAVPLDAINWGFDGTLSPFHIEKSAIVRDTVILISAVTGAVAFAFIRAKGRKVAFAALLIALNWVSMGSVSRVALAPTEPFNYPDSPIFDKPRQSGERIAGVGRSFLNPNTSMAYGLRDMRFTGALFTDRQMAFEQLSVPGGRPANKAYLSGPLVTRAIDLASVRYLISPGPLRSTADEDLAMFEVLSAKSKTGDKEKKSGSVKFAANLELIGAAVSIDASRREAFARLKWKADRAAKTSYALELALVDSEGREISSSQRVAVTGKKAGPDIRFKTMSVGIPKELPANKTVNLVLRTYSSYTECYVWPEQSSLRCLGAQVILHSFRLTDERKREALERRQLTNNGGVKILSSRFELIDETSRGIRLYENTTALPQAYIVYDAWWAAGEADAASQIDSAGFDPTTTAVLEAGRSSASGQESSGQRELEQQEAVQQEGYRKKRYTAGTVTRPSPNQVFVDVDARSPGWLLLTDTYYPGWVATVDGKEEKILRANFAFRAVPVGKGRHHVEFTYMPASLIAGLSLFALALFSIAAIALVRTARRGKGR